MASVDQFLGTPYDSGHWARCRALQDWVEETPPSLGQENESKRPSLLALLVWCFQHCPQQRLEHTTFGFSLTLLAKRMPTSSLVSTPAAQPGQDRAVRKPEHHSPPAFPRGTSLKKKIRIFKKSVFLTELGVSEEVGQRWRGSVARARGRRLSTPKRKGARPSLLSCTHSPCCGLGHAPSLTIT